MAMYQFQVETEGQRVDALLRKFLPELPPQVIRESFGRRDVKLNGKRVKPDARAYPGDLLQLYCMEQKAETL